MGLEVGVVGGCDEVVPAISLVVLAEGRAHGRAGPDAHQQHAGPDAAQRSEGELLLGGARGSERQEGGRGGDEQAHDGGDAKAGVGLLQPHDAEQQQTAGAEDEQERSPVALARRGRRSIGDVADRSTVGLAVRRLAILWLAILGLAVLGLAVLRLAVLRLAVLGLAVLGLAVRRLAVLRLAVLRLAVLGLAGLGLAVLGLAVRLAVLRLAVLRLAVLRLHGLRLTLLAVPLTLLWMTVGRKAVRTMSRMALSRMAMSRMALSRMALSPCAGRLNGSVSRDGLSVRGTRRMTHMSVRQRGVGVVHVCRTGPHAGGCIAALSRAEPPTARSRSSSDERCASSRRDRADVRRRGATAIDHPALVPLGSRIASATVSRSRPR